MEDNAWRLTLLLSLAGMGLGAYLTAVSYVSADLSYCAPSPFLSCEAVIYSPYSRLLGVPVALIGTVGFTTLFALSYLGLLGSEHRRDLLLWPTFLVALAGLGMGTYLTYVELFVIRSLCLLCVAAFSLVVPVVAVPLRAAFESASNRVEKG